MTATFEFDGLSVDNRLSRDTTDLLMIARDMQRAGSGLRSLAEPVVDTTSDSAELVLAMLGVAAKLGERRRIVEHPARGRADARPSVNRLQTFTQKVDALITPFVISDLSVILRAPPVPHH